LQQFFDLVVGTRYAQHRLRQPLTDGSTGGIIALAFGDMLWSVEKCTRKFKALAGQAFTKRKGQNMRLVRYVQLFAKKSRYETKPLERALLESFGYETPLFGARADALGRLNVAVTATTTSGNQAYVLSNYNTRAGRTNSGREDSLTLYRRYRPNQQRDELRVWEA
jgi:hypothetical protein